MRTVILVAAVSRIAFAEPPGLAPVHSSEPLTDEEQDVVDDGYIGGGRATGAIVLSVAGFGLGQAAEGRWHDTGWIFTLGDALTIATYTIGGAKGGNGEGPAREPYNTMFAIGLLAYFGLHTWEIVDAAVGIHRHNQRVTNLRIKGGLEPYITTTSHGDGAVAGMTLRF